MAKFGDIAELIQDRIAPKEDNTGNYIGLENLPSESLLITTWQSDVIPDSDKFLFKKGDVLFARRRAYQKKVGVAPFDGIISTDGMVFRPKPNIYGSLLPFIVKSDHFMNYAINNSAGTMSPRVKWKDLQNCEIKIPENELQKKYSDLLWHLENTIILLNERLTILDQLVKSRFNEMFRHNQYEEKPLAELFKTSSGGTPLKGKREYYEGGMIPWLTSGEVNDEHITEAKSMITELALQETSAKIPPLRSVLVSMYGSIGYTGILEFEAAINQAICAIHPNPEYTPEWVCHFIRSKKDELVNQGVGAALTNISQEKIRKLVVPLVPLPPQEAFTAFVYQVDKSKFELQKHLDDTKRLQKALINQAFDPKSVQN